MINNSGNESPFPSTILNNSSSITDVLDQIKKKSEEISTSEASIKFLNSLSNPTNLTNPLIINSFNYNQKNIVQKKNMNYALPSVNQNRKLFNNNDNRRQNLRKSKSQIIPENLQPFSTLDPLKLYDYNKLIEKAELEMQLRKEKEKNHKNINFKIIGRNIMNEKENLLYNKYLDPSSIIPEIHSDRERPNKEDIWEKVKNINLKPKSKENRGKMKTTNIIRFTSKNEYIEKLKLINVYYFKNKNKKERYHQYISIKKNYKNSINNIFNKLQKSKDFLENKYSDEYKEYIKFLIDKKGKEYALEMQLLSEENKILYEVHKLEKKIEECEKIKKDLIKWLYFQIEVKEKIVNVPEYYKKIIEDKISFSEINNKEKINLDINEYNRILNYRGKNVYNDANDFLKQIENLEMSTIFHLNNNYDLRGVRKLKHEYKELKKKNNNMINDENIKKSILMNALKIQKTMNIQLNYDLFILKNPKINKKENDQKLINELVMYARYHSNEEGLNFFLKNNKPIIYYYAICLYYIVSVYDSKEIKKLEININNINNEMLLDILNYAEKIVNLLLIQRKKFYSDPNLKKQYELIKDDMDKKSLNEKIFIQMKIQKELEESKKQKLKERINKKYFKPKRKIDFDYYRKEIHKKRQILINNNIKNETKFEDFLFDIYS